MKEITNKSHYNATFLAIFLLLIASCNSKETVNEPYFRIEGSTELSVSEGESVHEYSVKSNGKWDILRKSAQAWAEATPFSGRNDGSFRIAISENKSKANRSLSFSFLLNGNEVPEKISVAQQGNPNGIDDGDGGGDGDGDEDEKDDCEDCPLYTVSKIWDQGNHNAFTDLIKFGGKYFCAFREAGAHVPQKPEDDGKIRILVSTDGVAWETAALIVKDGIDCRDPKLSITPDGRLMVLFDGAIYRDGVNYGRTDHVSFSENSEGKWFSTPQPIIRGQDVPAGWLWRVTWDRYTGYGVMYQSSNIYLLSTTNGINYTLVTKLNVTGSPNESTVEMLGNNKMRIVVRRDQANNNTGYIGYSGKDYTEWTWTDLGVRLGGPHIITLPNGKTIIGSRSFRGDGTTRTSLFELNNQTNNMTELLELPSGGDTSYPGFVVVGNELWVSYYSSHDAKTSIYFAKVRYKKLFN